MEYGAIYSEGRSAVFRSSRCDSSTGRDFMHTGCSSLVKDKHVAPDFTALGVGQVSSSFFWVSGMGQTVLENRCQLMMAEMRATMVEMRPMMVEVRAMMVEMRDEQYWVQTTGIGHLVQD